MKVSTIILREIHFLNVSYTRHNTVVSFILQILNFAVVPMLHSNTSTNAPKSSRQSQWLITSSMWMFKWNCVIVEMNYVTKRETLGISFNTESVL